MPNFDGLSPMVGTHLGNLTLSGTTSASSAWLDTRGFDTATLMAIPNTVTDAGTASGFTFVVEESDSTAGASATAVADVDLVGLESGLTVTSDSADNTICGAIGYIGNSRYVRLTVTGTTGTDADVTVVGLQSKASYQPASFVGTSVAAT